MQVLVFLAIIGILILIELWYYRKHALDDIDLDVRFSKPVAQFGEIIEVIEKAENRKRAPLPFLILKFETPVVLEFQDMTKTTVSDYLYREDMVSMKPYSRHTRTIKARCSKRGYYSFARINISTSDLLLIEKIAKDYPTERSVTILPEYVDTSIMDSFLSITFSEIQRRRTLLTDPFSFAGIRDYQPWDSMKTINWTATAKTGDLMVNQVASTATKKVSVYVNLDYYNNKKSESLLEKSISFAYSYMQELVLAGIPVTLYTNGRDIQTKAPVIADSPCDQSNFMQRGIALARIDLSQDVVPFEELFEGNTGSLSDEFIVIVSTCSYPQVTEAVRKLRNRGASLLWIMPAYRSTPRPELDADLARDFKVWEVIGHD